MKATNILFLSIFYVLQASSQSVSDYIKYGELYRNNNTFIELLVKKAVGSNPCTNVNKFKLNVADPNNELKQSSKYLTWGLNVINCNGDSVRKTFSLPISQHASDGMNMSIDWTFEGISFDIRIYESSFSPNSVNRPDQLLSTLKKGIAFKYQDKYWDTCKTVNINGTIWVTSNLNVAHFKNGDRIPEARTADEWKKAADTKQPAWCYYGNDSLMGKRFGRLYNWYAVSDSRGLAADGYHISADYDWVDLQNAFAPSSLKNTMSWQKEYAGDNKSSLGAVASGWRDEIGNFSSLYVSGHWWTTLEHETGKSIAWQLTQYKYEYHPYQWIHTLTRGGHKNGHGFSIRCIKD
jgi:uncharacterized protein (TIGR02145 family)